MLALVRLANISTAALFILLWTAGCQQPQQILIDYSATPIRFIIHHRGWPRPFQVPRVTEFAIAGDQDDALWELRTKDEAGLPADGLAIVYGETPPGFIQVLPESNATPKALEPGRTYFVAAGGPKHVYRMVFALPLDPLEIRRPTPLTTAPSSQK